MLEMLLRAKGNCGEYGRANETHDSESFQSHVCESTGLNLVKGSQPPTTSKIEMKAKFETVFEENLRLEFAVDSQFVFGHSYMPKTGGGGIFVGGNSRKCTKAKALNELCDNERCQRRI